MRTVFAALAIVALLAVACGGGGAAPGGGSGGDAANGEQLLKQAMIGSQPSCITCHSLDGSRLVGPTLQGIGTRAGKEVAGKSAEEYLRESIIDPNAHVVKEYSPGVMQSYEKELSDQQLADLVAYLLTLK